MIDRRDHGPLVLAACLSAMVVVLRVLSPGVPDTGDGIAHYQHARYFWSEPMAALSQWGKPVFSLLASPFAQFGMWGISLFGALCTALAAWVTMDLLNGSRERAWRWAVPVLLCCVPVQVSTVFAGLTEPLFGLASVLVVHALWHRRHVLAMILVSLFPFIRPEYAAFMPFVLALLLLRKAYRALPWGLLGIVFYSLASAIFLGQPWAFFTQQTYLGKDVYGRGSIWHYADQLDAIYGMPFTYAVALAIAAALVLLWRDREGRRSLLEMTWLTLLPAASIFALHSFAWWKGGMASLGLIRVMATTVPLLVLFSTFVFARCWSRWMPVGRWGYIALSAAVAIYGYHAVQTVFRELIIPFPGDEVQHTQRKVADFLVAHRGPGQRIIHLDPFIGALCKLNPWDPSSTVNLSSVDDLQRSGQLEPGDWLVWDGHFAASEGRATLDSFLHDRRLSHVAEFLPRIPVEFRGKPYSIHVFQRLQPNAKHVDDLVFPLTSGSAVKVETMDTLAHKGSGVLLRGAEFPLTLSELPIAKDGMTGEFFQVQITLAGPVPSSGVFLVYTAGSGEHQAVYDARPLHEGPMEMRFMVGPEGHQANKLYIWNKTGQELVLKEFEVRYSGWDPDGL